MTDKEFHNKGFLVSRLENMPRGYGEGKLMSSNDARRIASVVMEDFFLVPRIELPDVYVDKETITAEEAWVHTTGRPLDAVDDEETRFDSILGATANYLAIVEIHKHQKERDEQGKRDIEFAFTLFKAADPLNLHYTSWNHVSRLEQSRWLNVARKAREELHKSNDLAL